MKLTEVKDKATQDAFAVLGIKTLIKGVDTTGEGAEDVTLLKGQVDTLNATLAEKEAEIAELKKGIAPGTEIPAELASKLDAVGILSKAVIDGQNLINENIENLSKSFTEKVEEMADTIDKIGKEGKAPRSGGQSIKKAFEKEEGSDKEQLSKSMHGREIVDLLDKLSDEGKNEMYMDAATRFETSRHISKGVIDDLAAKHNISIVD